MRKDKILVIGANGQLGRVLTDALRQAYGNDQVIATDIKKVEGQVYPFEFLDILNRQRFRELVRDHKITQIYHLAAILSANGEWNPGKTWNVNFNGLISVLKLAQEENLDKVFFPSSIAIYGNSTPKVQTPQHASFEPTTVYGISKLSGEFWCNYYHARYGLDVRSLRYPGIIGHQSLPSGGTTDYAVEIFHEALKHKKYTCFLEADTRLPMIYMEDAINSTIQLMEAPTAQITTRMGYNLSGMDFTPAELAAEIKKWIPDFTIVYKPDFRQAIAKSWSESIDDSTARKDWNWQPKYDLVSMTKDMIEILSKKLLASTKS